jgi:hypothetical protein
MEGFIFINTFTGAILAGTRIEFGGRLKVDEWYTWSCCVWLISATTYLKPR